MNNCRTMSAKEICNELGFEPEEAEEAYEHVQNRINAIDNFEENMSSRSITNEDTVFLHQLIKDNDGNDCVVTDLHEHAIELTEIDMVDDEMQWGESETFTPGDIAMYFDPQFELVGGEWGVAQEVPVWAY